MHSVALPAPERSRILVAEDDPAMRLLLCEALAEAGYEVQSLPDGTRLMEHLDAAQAGRRQVPDLVVSDVRLPGRSGIEVLELVRARDWATPVLLVTAFSDAKVHAEGRRLGAVEVVDKPFELDEFIELVTDLVPPVI